MTVMSMKDKLYRFSLLFITSAIILSGCVTNNFCRSSDKLEKVTGVSSVEIVDATKIRITKETGAPVYFIDAKGNVIEADILGLLDSIVIRDEHYGAEFKVIDITQESISFEVHEGWTYPVSGWCNPGQSSGTIMIKPYNTHHEQKR